jgi:lysophospholipid acyltransferase (LPLAT)-like uncharacterized protein
MKRTVNEIPVYILPLFYPIAAFFWCLYQFLRLTCRIRFHGPDLNQEVRHRVLCIWHDDWMVLFTVFKDMPNEVWMGHPAWYMKHVYIVAEWLGVQRFVLGSTGNEGRKAADELVREVKAGASTAMAIDGPYGPKHVLKKGALHIAAQSGVPIVGLRFRLSKFIALPTWEKKRLPWPFSAIDVEVSDPIYVDPANMEVAAEKLTSFLNG